MACDVDGIVLVILCVMVGIKGKDRELLGTTVSIGGGYSLAAKHSIDAYKHPYTAHGIESFPGLGVEAALWLMQKRQIKSIGIDTASIDYGKSRDFSTHVALMSHNIPAFENVANLDQLPAIGAYVIALPVKIRDGSGGPLRIIARVEH